MMKAYTYHQLPASSQETAEENMSARDHSANDSFWRTVTAGLKRRGLPARELGSIRGRTRLTGDFMSRLPLRVTSAESTYCKLRDAGIELYLVETQDGIVFVESEQTFEQMAFAIDVPRDTIVRFMRYISSVVEEDLRYARKHFIDEAVGAFGMPPLFTEKGEKIEYDLYE